LLIFKRNFYVLIITSIEEQKKKGRFNIFLDGEYAFGLYRETIYHFGLRTKDELDEKRIGELKSYDEINFGKKVAYRFLNFKPRSEKEVRTKLKGHKLSDESIDKILDSLKEFKFVNDEQYAKMYIESKVSLKPEGRRSLKIRLAQKGIGKETSEKTVEENYTEETEFQKALDLVTKYQKKVKAKTAIEKKQKCYKHLLSKGFSYDLINRVLKVEDNTET
jgi:regulatory protein